METTETDRLTIKDAAPFVLVILVTLAVIGFIVTASSAHAEETTSAQGNEYIKQTVEYTLGEADLLPAVCNEGYATSIGCDDVYKWESGSVKNAVNYKVSVENGFGATAYFRTVIALESSADARALTFLNATIADFTWIKVGESINIDGIKYAVYVATYNNPLAAGSTVELVSQIAMKPSVGSSEVATLGNGYNIMVMTQAVAAEAGDTQTVDASFLDTAFGTITASNHPWSGSSDGSSSSTTEASGEASN